MAKKYCNKINTIKIIIKNNNVEMNKLNVLIENKNDTILSLCLEKSKLKNIFKIDKVGIDTIKYTTYNLKVVTLKINGLSDEIFLLLSSLIRLQTENRYFASMLMTLRHGHPIKKYGVLYGLL